MKVLQINSVCGYGSTGRIAVDLYHALEKEGHECCIAYGRGSAPEDIKSYRIGTNKDVYIHGILSRITDRHGFYSKNATKKFAAWMKEYNPDVIHLHNLHGYYINIQILFEALKKMGKPIVWTLHDCWAFTGHCSHFDYVGCDKWKYGCRNCPQKKEYPSSYFMDNSRMNYKVKAECFKGLEDRMVLVTPSRWLADTVKESYLKEYKTEVIYNGVDLEIFKPTESDFRERNQLENKKIILGVANVWSKRKGLDVFNELAKKLDDSYQIIIVGIDSKQRGKINPKIISIERTQSKHELAELYSCADLYLNPSYEETMGLTTVEALACGTNVLVRNRTALPEIVEYCKDKILSEDNMENSVISILEKGNESKNNRALASKYEKKCQYTKYIDVYKKVLLREERKG